MPTRRSETKRGECLRIGLISPYAPNWRENWQLPQQCSCCARHCLRHYTYSDIFHEWLICSKEKCAESHMIRRLLGFIVFATLVAAGVAVQRDTFLRRWLLPTRSGTL